MNNILLIVCFFIVGSLIAYFLSKYINNDLKRENIDKYNYIVSLIGGFSYVLVYLQYHLGVYSILLCLLSSVLLLIAVYDYLSKEIKNSFLLMCGLVCLVIFIYNVFYLKEQIADYLFSFLVALVFFVGISLIGKLLFKKEALGDGDIYLACIISIIFKPFAFIVSILIASLTGSVIEIIKMKINNTGKDMEIAFCPYLCFGFFVGILFMREIMNLL